MTATAPIQIFTEINEVQLCSARDLHERLEVGRDFTTWVKDRIEEYGFVEGQDYMFCSPNLGSKKIGSGGHNRTEYHITIDMAKELAMLENNDKGRAVRRYFIQAERALREELRDAARHVHTLPGVTAGIWEGMTMRQVETLQRQSRDTMAELVATTHPAQQRNLHLQLRQINNALGIPTETLEEINGAPLPLTNGKGE